jgi:hypothetical protein
MAVPDLGEGSVMAAGGELGAGAVVVEDVAAPTVSSGSVEPFGTNIGGSELIGWIIEDPFPRAAGEFRGGAF